MSTTLNRIQDLAARGEIRVSAHGYDELAADGILATDAITGLSRALIVEDYPTYSKGPAVLVLDEDATGLPIHVVWGIPKGKDSPGVLVTAYRPDPTQWDTTFRRRQT